MALLLARRSFQTSGALNLTGLTGRPERIEAKIKEALQTDQVQVHDDSPSGDGGHVEVEVISHLFAGKTRLQQHRMVNEAVGDEMKTIHALHVRTALPN